MTHVRDQRHQIAATRISSLRMTSQYSTGR